MRKCVAECPLGIATIGPRERRVSAISREIRLGTMVGPPIAQWQSDTSIVSRGGELPESDWMDRWHDVRNG